MDVIAKVTGPALSEVDDLTLVVRMRQGDRDAFTLLAQRYQDRVYNLCLRMSGNSHDACDLAQETFLRVLRTIERFRGDSSFYTWLFRVALNQCLSARRKARVRERADGALLAGGRLRLVPVGGIEEAVDQTPPQGDSMEREEIHARVMSAIAGLDEEQRVVVVLRDVEGCDYEEIGQMLEIPPGTVKSRLHRARQALREQLKDVVDEP